MKGKVRDLIEYILKLEPPFNSTDICKRMGGSYAINNASSDLYYLYRAGVIARHENDDKTSTARYSYSVRQDVKDQPDPATFMWVQYRKHRISKESSTAREAARQPVRLALPRRGEVTVLEMIAGYKEQVRKANETRSALVQFIGSEQGLERLMR